VTPSRKSRLDFRDGVTYSRDVAKKKLPPEVLEYFTRMGRKGGLMGGPARAAALTQEERSESARKAVQARWAKAKPVADDIASGT
jgi:hypothetical protein